MKLSARNADKYRLYRISVQTPEEDARFLARRFQQITGHSLRRLREDFCGAGNILCEFIKLHKDNTGLGLDLDPVPLQWCRRNNFNDLSPDQQRRITLLQKNVNTATAPPADMVLAFNFSFFVFKTRKEMLAYFRAVRKSMRSGGLFVLDAFGGSDVPKPDTERWNQGNFWYIWQVKHFDPLTNEILCKIHFEFKDGTRMQNAFEYDWRLWSIPELSELLEEAGFRDIQILWEGTDSKTNMGNGVMRRIERGHPERTWYVYLIAQK